MLIFRDATGNFRVTGPAISLAIDQTFDANQPNHFGVPPASRQALVAGQFIGDTRRGGSCNVDSLQLIPHCNGTHTETAGHIVNEAVPVAEAACEAWFLARVISVEPAAASGSGDRYDPPFGPYDLVVSRAAIARALSQRHGAAPTAQPSALIVRTLPNEPGKRSRDWSAGAGPVFLTGSAMEAVLAAGFSHLLIDLPSLDRMQDEGRMHNHCLFWEVDPDTRLPLNRAALDRTVTELIFVPDEVADGHWLLNLQIAPFAIDAAPSRPLVFGLERMNE